jgi:hypothetical protein
VRTFTESALAGAAYASWTSSGTGIGTGIGIGIGAARADTVKPLVVEPATTDAETPLFRGDTVIKVTDISRFAVDINSVKSKLGDGSCGTTAFTSATTPPRRPATAA